MRRVLILLALTLSPIGLSPVSAAPAGALADPILDKPLPDFRLQGVRPGEPVLTTADLTGQPRLLNVFASWCPGCGEEAPALQQAADQGAVIFGLDWKDQPDEARDFLRDNGDPYTRIGGSTDGELVAKLNISLAPQTLVIDRHGVVRYRLAGLMTDTNWRETIQPLLQKLAQEK